MVRALILSVLTLIAFFSKAQAPRDGSDEELVQMWELSSDSHLIPAGEFIQFIFHGENNMTVRTVCNTWNCLYIWESSDMLIVRYKDHVRGECEEIYEPNLVRQLLNGFYIPFRGEGIMHVYSNPNQYVFKSSRVEDTFERVDPCSLEPDGGTCRALFIKYFYNQSAGKCESFNWGGCSGTVPFETLEECQKKCGR